MQKINMQVIVYIFLNMDLSGIGVQNEFSYKFFFHRNKIVVLLSEQ